MDLKIVELQTEKQGTATLNDLIEILKNETDMDYIVSLTEIASITGVDAIGDAKEIYVVYKIYQFRVDDKLETKFISIVENYAPDVTITSNIKSYEGKNADGKYIAKVEVKVESKELVKSIKLETVNGTITEVPTQLPYTKEIEVEIGNKYITKVTAQDGKVKKYVVEEKANETIKNAQELATFRDNVNSGLTYEGKTIELLNDIQFNEGKYSITDGKISFNSDAIQWTSIGTETTSFSGTFDGKYHTIKGLYIYNNNREKNGLFDTIGKGGIVKNLILDEILISNTQYATNGIMIGGIAAINYGMIEKCQIKSNSELFAQETYTYNNVIAGGIVGINYNIIKECVNNAKIGANQNTNEYEALIGGISGTNGENGNIYNCYNTGYIYSDRAGGTLIGGISGANFSVVEKCYDNCYNIGSVTSGGARYYVLIASIIGANYSSKDIENIYFIGTMRYAYNNCYGYTILESKDIGKTDLDVMKTQEFVNNLNSEFIIDQKNSDGTWKYNNGYPILKWQIGE